MTNTIKSTSYGYELSREYVDGLLTGKTNKGGYWGKDTIKYLLLTNDRMVIASLIKLYNYQTDEEQSTNSTVDSNGVGFNSFDSDALSNIARQCLEKLSISAKQVNFVRHKIVKYSGQIAKIAMGNI